MFLNIFLNISYEKLLIFYFFSYLCTAIAR